MSDKAKKREPKEPEVKKSEAVFCQLCHTEVENKDVCSHCGEPLV